MPRRWMSPQVGDMPVCMWFIPLLEKWGRVESVLSKKIRLSSDFFGQMSDYLGRRDARLDVFSNMF